MTEEGQVRIEDIDPAFLSTTGVDWETEGEEKPGPVCLRIAEAALGALKFKKGQFAGKVMPTCELELEILARPNQKFENPAIVKDRINLCGKSIKKFTLLATRGCGIKVPKTTDKVAYVEVMKAMKGKVLYANLIEDNWKDTKTGEMVQKRTLGYRFGKSFSDLTT